MDQIVDNNRPVIPHPNIQPQPPDQGAEADGNFYSSEQEAHLNPNKSEEYIQYIGEQEGQTHTIMGDRLFWIPGNDQRHQSRYPEVQIKYNKPVENLWNQSQGYEIPNSAFDIFDSDRLSIWEKHSSPLLAFANQDEQEYNCLFDEPNGCWKTKSGQEKKSVKLQIGKVPLNNCTIQPKNIKSCTVFLDMVQQIVSASMLKMNAGQFQLILVAKKQKCLLNQPYIKLLCNLMRLKLEVRNVKKVVSKFQKDSDQSYFRYTLVWGIKSENS